MGEKKISFKVTLSSECTSREHPLCHPHASLFPSSSFRYNLSVVFCLLLDLFFECPLACALKDLLDVETLIFNFFLYTDDVDELNSHRCVFHFL